MEPHASEPGASASAPRDRTRRRWSRSRARRLLGRLDGTPRLIAQLSLATGLEPREVLRLQVADLDLARRRISLRGSSKKGKRRARIPAAALPELERLLAVVRRLHALDAARGRASTARGRIHQWLFPSPSLERNRRTGELARPHLDPRRVERAFETARRALGRTG